MTKINLSMLPMVTTPSGYVLIETSIARVKPELEVYQWAHRTGQWELVKMNTVQSAVHQFYSTNPDWLPKPIEEVLGEFEKALRHEQKQAQVRQQEVEATKKQGITILHQIFDEEVGNKMMEAILFERYHTHLLLAQAAKGKGKLSMPSREDKQSIEKTLREHVLVEPTFKVHPSVLGRPATVSRLIDSENNPTDEHAAEVARNSYEGSSSIIIGGKTFIRFMSAVKDLGYHSKEQFFAAKRHYGIKENEPISVKQLQEYLTKK